MKHNCHVVVVLCFRYKQVHDICANKAVVILPAFESNKYNDNMGKAHALAEVAASMDKATLRSSLIQSDSICIFNLYRYRANHNCTLYNTWYEATDYYKVEVCNRAYEPWYIAHRQLNPWYDARFRGYGWNKISHVHETQAAGFSFYVHPEAFIVHRLHPKSKVNLSFLTFNQKARDAQESSKAPAATTAPSEAADRIARYDIMHTNRKHMLQIEADRKAGRYKVSVHQVIGKCRHSLPWWQFDVSDMQSLATRLH